MNGRILYHIGEVLASEVVVGGQIKIARFFMMAQWYLAAMRTPYVVSLNAKCMRRCRS